MVNQDWTWEDVGGYQPRRYQFTPTQQPGTAIIYGQDEESSRLNVLNKIFTENLATRVCDSTNRYHHYRQGGQV